MIEIFKTNVQNKKQANALTSLLLAYLPCAKISFDLEDRDKVLKVKSKEFCVLSVMAIFIKKGFTCTVLE